MTDLSTQSLTDDPGTLAGDRRFRPDVEGLRAVAVVAVVLFHARLLGFAGGFVGVDVFYVISGFVITGVLLRKFEASGSIGFADFYARRARRILPAAGLVLIVTILASYHWLGFIRGGEVADDARWCAVFLGNFHFLAVGTNYFSSQLPPSPLQNFWSLAVEEQFYLIYPCALGLSLILIPKVSVRHKVMILTTAIIAGSLIWSIYQTSVDPYSAYLSSLTRAWELALGGFVAAGTQYWLMLRRHTALVLTWLGIAAILVACLHYTSATSYPGWAAILPVGGAAFIIAGGMSAGRWGAEVVLGTFVFRWIGKLSYSIYLWSWPMLTIAMQSTTRSLSLPQRLLTILASVVLAALTYAFIENPIRHSKWIATSWWRGVVLGSSIIAVVLVVATLEMQISGATTNSSQGSSPRLSAFPTLSQVSAQISTAETTAKPPQSVSPSLSTLAAYGDFGFADAGKCAAPGTNSSNVRVSACTFGDKSSTETLVLTGDSRAQMWLDTFMTIADDEHFKLVLLAKSGCPSPFATYRVNNNGTFSNSAWTACTKWHTFVSKTIDNIQPQVVVMSSESDLALADPVHYASAAEIQRDTSAFIKSIPSPTKTVILGGFPEPGAASSPTLCLSKSPHSLLTCSFTPSRDVDINNQAVKVAARADGAGFINQTPWLCGSACPAVIDGIVPYTIDGYHIDNTYSVHLTGVLWAALSKYVVPTA